MPPPNRPRHPSGIADLDWLITDDGSRTLHDKRLRETYHSGCGAVAETLIVYLWNSGVAERLRTGQATQILEYGFGTATGLLLTAALAEYYRTPLYYLGLDSQLLPGGIFRDLDLFNSTTECIGAGLAQRPFERPDYHTEQFVALPSLVEQLCRVLTFNGPPPQDIEADLSEFVRLRLWIGDAAEFDATAPETSSAVQFQAVYFDPFSPQSSPELWQREVYARATKRLVEGGTFTSYCVKSDVRHDLEAIGLRVKRLPGPVGGKRQVLLAVK